MYGGAAETRFANDLEDCVAWIEDSVGEPRTVQSAQFQAERLLTLRTRRSAAYKGLYALQMKQGSRNFRRRRCRDRHCSITGGSTGRSSRRSQGVQAIEWGGILREAVDGERKSTIAVRSRR